MQFVLMGFTPDIGFRVFEFEGIRADQTRAEFSVRTDLSLARAYGIALQELPLLCRRLLEGRDQGEPQRMLTFTEGEMRIHANIREADREAAKRRTSIRRRPSPKVEQASESDSGVN